MPANFTLIGNGVDSSSGGVPLHSHDFDFNDDVLSVGVRYYLALVDQMLS